MTKVIDLKAYPRNTRKLNYSAGDILNKVEQGKAIDRVTQSWGLVTSGILEITQITGGISWAISDYIAFSYVYNSRPIFTWGLDGTAGIDWSAGDNVYSPTLPASLSALYQEPPEDEEDPEEEEEKTETYQPAIFVPRIIHWHCAPDIFLGCYILVCQLNPECTETDKVLRLHYRFEGDGHVA
jgi:hypothetical protein